MKRLALIAAVALPLFAVTTVPTFADAKTKQLVTVKFEGLLGGFANMFGGKAAKEGVTTTTAVKGNRKSSMNEQTGQIIDLSEEKVYDLNIKKKEYTVTTFEQMRQKMRESAEKAKEQQEKAEPTEKEKPQKEYEVDFDLKETGQKKQIAGYDTHETIATVTVREKGKTLEESGGIVMTTDIWLGPRLPEMKELADFNVRYWKQLQQGSGVETISPEQAAQLLALFPLVSKAMDRMAKDGDKLAGTPLDTTMTIEGVKSPEQTTQSQQSGGGGGIGGMLGRKLMKKDAPKQRSLIMTTHHQVLEVGKSVDATDLAVPADFKEKK
jgi:hypothetical protein